MAKSTPVSYLVVEVGLTPALIWQFSMLYILPHIDCPVALPRRDTLSLLATPVQYFILAMTSGIPSPIHLSTRIVGLTPAGGLPDILPF
jgi:hypothetical protein